MKNIFNKTNSSGLVPCLRGFASHHRILFVVLLLSNATVQAVPDLQLGPGGFTSAAGTGSFNDWNYDDLTDTWIFSGNNSFSVDLTAKRTYKNNGDVKKDAFGTANDGGNGYEGLKEAYLVLSATPKGSGGDGGNPEQLIPGYDGFDVSISNASFFANGFGAPPITDPNSLAPHSIFDTYFELYKVTFDGVLGNIFNTEPVGNLDANGVLSYDGEASTEGFWETVDITINSLTANVTGIHLDLFTLDPANTDNVLKFAPFSHDAEWAGTPPTTPQDPPPGLPEPTSLWLMGVGLLGLYGAARKKTRAN